MQKACSLLRRLVSVLKDDEWVIDMTHAANDALEAATSQSLVLDTSRRRPRTGTKMFKRTLKKKKKHGKGKCFPVVCLILMMVVVIGFECFRKREHEELL